MKGEFTTLLPARQKRDEKEQKKETEARRQALKGENYVRAGEGQNAR